MHKQVLAPVILFVYNRPTHTKQALDSLINNKQAADSILYVFADGPKLDATKDDLQKIKETRQLFKNLNGFKEVILIEKEKNEGLASSVITGVTDIVNKHGKVIVLEDDLILSAHFLEFMNEGLTLYDSSSNIYSINGFMFPINYPINETIALPFTSTWGWATWASKWQYFDTNMKGKEFLIENPHLAEKFNLGDYKFNKMLHFENNSWGIKWYFSVFLRGGLNIFPSQSLVNNIGFDGSGTNGERTNKNTAKFSSEKIQHTKTEMIDLLFFNKFINHFKKENISLFERITGQLKRPLKL